MNPEIKERSLQVLFYMLCRDCIPVGELYRIIREIEKLKNLGYDEIDFSIDGLKDVACDVIKRLQKC